MPKTKHGQHGSPLYQCWNSIQQRCENPNAAGYKDYGGRGIRMCKRWRESFGAFYHDCKDLYRPGCWIERVDNNGHYEPGNVCWVKRITQMNNQRTTAFIDTPKGRMSVAQAARWFGINVNTLRKRYLKGDRGERLFRPTGEPRKDIVQVETPAGKMTLREAAAHFGISLAALKLRYYRNRPLFPCLPNS